MNFMEKGRLLSVKTPLGTDKLLLEGFSGSEQISGLFSFKLFLLSEEKSISFDAIVGKTATVQVDDGGTKRHFNGIVSQFSQGNLESRFVRYHATLVPWLWNLTQCSDCRIFQSKTVPEIIEAVFQDRGFQDYKLKLNATYSPRDYCVQYDETDFDFVSRLMEEEGIFYFFEHEADKHTLVLGDAPSAYPTCPGQSSAPYAPNAGPQGGESVSAFLLEQEVRPAQYTLTDYNFEQPSTSLGVQAPTLITVGRNDKLEVYEYPGEYRKLSEGERYAKLRMEAQEVPHLRARGGGDCRSFTSGHVFTLKGHYRDAYNGKYLLTSVSHDAASNMRQGGGDASYSNAFTCIPAKVPYRPARATARPRMVGVQTAVVVGPNGEEIYTDKYGRVKVQFHWDRKGKMDENSSCWIRVATSWAGKQWGAISLPRIGQEVIVSFLEGDPDQPLIVGSVYNGEQMPPYALPANATRSTLKSNSSKGGKGFNELRLEDKKGEEQIFMHAEKDLDVRVKNDAKETVSNNRHLLVESDQLEQVDGDKHATIKGDLLESISGNHGLKVSGNLLESAGQSISIKAGMEIVISAGMQITLKAGGSSIVIGPAGVQIDGLLVQLNCGGSGSSPQDPDPPKAPEQADDDQAGEVSSAGQKALADSFKKASRQGTPFVVGG
jgi:type VI secretion system secreted protein VgrG